MRREKTEFARLRSIMARLDYQMKKEAEEAEKARNAKKVRRMSSSGKGGKEGSI